MKLSLVTIHAYETPQAIPLAAASLAANLIESLRVDASLIDLFNWIAKGSSLGDPELRSRYRLVLSLFVEQRLGSCAYSAGNVGQTGNQNYRRWA